MAWKAVSIMSQRHEFVVLCQESTVPFSTLCRRYGISRETGYKWIDRYRLDGVCGLQDRSRRPHHSPGRTGPEQEAAVLSLRDEHPAWGARKLHARLRVIGEVEPPSSSTIHAILKRNGRVDESEAKKHRAFHRLEHAAPNDLWQMDFKGHFAVGNGRCFPLTILDDHSRFSLCLSACPDERHETVQPRLVEVFRRYGLPLAMTMDNGSPWGACAETKWTRLGVWLVRLGIYISHSRPYHPQTQGKDERFHRTLNAELLRYDHYDTLGSAQCRFDQWRDQYNLIRPHEALGMAVPSSRYHSSAREYPELLPAIEYGPNDLVRKVQNTGVITVNGNDVRVGTPFKGQPVALRATSEQGTYKVVYCNQTIRTVSFKEPLKIN